MKKAHPRSTENKRTPLAGRGGAHVPCPSNSDAHPYRLYRPSRLAELLDVHESTIWRWRQRGILPPPVEIGGIRGWTDEMLRFLFSQQQGA